MLKELFILLKTSPSYRWISLGLIISGLGSAFTSVAVYAELGDSQASAFLYSLAFIGAMFPALLSSALTERLGKKIPLVTLLMTIQALGALALLVPLLGTWTKNIWLLLLSECLASFAAGLMYPAYQTVIRRQLKEHQIAASSQLDVFAFAANVILGQGLGILLHTLMGTQIYLAFDFMTYLLAIFLIFKSFKQDPLAFRPSTPVQTSIKEIWTPKQRRVFLWMPVLALSCAPTMSVVPMLGEPFGKQIFIGSLALSPALLFLLSRSLGQLLGPFFVRKTFLETWLNHRLMIPLCILTYLLFYFLAFLSPYLILTLLAIVTAHIASNLVYTIANYGFRKSFSETQMLTASARNYQLSLLAISFSSATGGFLAETYGFVGALAMGSIGLLLSFILGARHGV